MLGIEEQPLMQNFEFLSVKTMAYPDILKQMLLFHPPSNSTMVNFAALKYFSTFLGNFESGKIM